MTCILFHQGDLYTDARHLRGGEAYQSLHKVTKLEKPFVMEYDPVEVKASVTGLHTEVLSDRIHGYVVAGNEESGKECCRVISTIGINSALTRYAFILDDTALLNQENGFNLVLIGEKAEYVVSVHPGEREAFFRVMGRDHSHAYGSGNRHVINNLQIYQDVIVALYATFLAEPTCGGLVDCWCLPTVEDPRLRRMGVYEPPHDTVIRKMIAENAIVMPDMVNYETLQNMMKRAFRAGLFIGQNPRAVAKVEKQIDDAEFFKHSVSIFGRTDEESAQHRTDVLNDWIRQGLVLARWTRPKKSKKKPATTRRSSRDK